MAAQRDYDPIEITSCRQRRLPSWKKDLFPKNCNATIKIHLDTCGTGRSKSEIVKHELMGERWPGVTEPSLPLSARQKPRADAEPISTTDGSARLLSSWP
jgi:hypothetical protein